MNKALGYKDIGLISRHISTIEHRSDINLEIPFAGTKLTIPLVASPMPDVCDGKMARVLAENGSYGFIHRFMDITEQVQQYTQATRKEEILDSYWKTTTNLKTSLCGCAIGINEGLERIEPLYDSGCRSFVIDVANGAATRVTNFVEAIINKFSNAYITVGNVASKECCEYLCSLPIYAIRVGIANGNVCTTKTETGIFFPMVSSISECVEAIKSWTVEYNNQAPRFPIPPLLIADGGITEPGDMCKALMLGANLVMVGGILAETLESPARTLKINGQLKKVFRGAASFSTQVDAEGKEPEYVEGMESLRPYCGSVVSLLKRYRNGLKSSMSYMNAMTLEEYRNNGDWCVI